MCRRVPEERRKLLIRRTGLKARAFLLSACKYKKQAGAKQQRKHHSERMRLQRAFFCSVSGKPWLPQLLLEPMSTGLLPNCSGQRRQRGRSVLRAIEKAKDRFQLP